MSMLPPVESAVLRKLARQTSGNAPNLRSELNLATDIFEAAILKLRKRGMLTVTGPSNANAVLGQDIDEAELTALGFMTAHHLP